MLQNVVTIILAGGKGTRLEPLTRDRAKPAVPFGGQYRIIDFTLSNCINSHLRRIRIATQFKSHSLARHIRLGWNFLSPELNESVDVLPPQQRIDEHWYKGTADAVYQNIYTLERDEAEYTLILAGDHIYKMNYGRMIEAHIRHRADITIGCIPVPLNQCKHFGILTMDENHRVTGFMEKPETCPSLQGDPHHAMGSMGIYVFKSKVMFERLCEDAAKTDSQHDFGKDIIPTMLKEGEKVYGFQFQDENRKATPYWRDVGTLDAYYEANMDLIGVDPLLNLYDPSWPIRTAMPQFPPPKFVHAGEGVPGTVQRGEAIESLVCPGCIISGGHVRRSVLGPMVRVNSYAVVEDSLLFDGVEIGRHSRVRRAILDKGAIVPANATIGFDSNLDRSRGFVVTEKGITVVSKGEPAETFR